LAPTTICAGAREILCTDANPAQGVAGPDHMGWVQAKRADQLTRLFTPVGGLNIVQSVVEWRMDSYVHDTQRSNPEDSSTTVAARTSTRVTVPSRVKIARILPRPAGSPLLFMGRR
jgi:hypothetical protein